MRRIISLLWAACALSLLFFAISAKAENPLLRVNESATRLFL